ncbi:MAG: cyclopropane-fatty-acyl-phospholipid synthase family protein [Burkholderiales bacterium]|nr:cyclopropane-fatty-acyl-phospholipid synthase family protein [Burkholderiales bacterium]
MSNTLTDAAPPSGNEPSAARWLFRLLEQLRFGSITLRTPDGRHLEFAGARPGPHATLSLADWQTCSDILRKGDIGLAEAYIAGRASTDDLTQLLLLGALNEQAIEQAIHGRWWATLAYRLRHWLRPNTRAGSRRNIHAHYDIGNEFYRLWLDGTMTYSAALFDGDLSLSLEQAQTAKYALILRELGARPGDHILEVGCGWGGFAEHAARAGCRVTGITVSGAQLEYARARIAAAGLQDRVEFRLCDYRDLEGQYDHIASIEMFEAVGERYWPGYFAALRQRLKPGGRAVVQTITIAESKFERYRGGTDFIQQYIFPGGMLPSPERFRAEAAEQGLALAGTHAFGLDYAETLRHWHRRFHAVAAQVEAQGFDERFMRTWRFYLAYCEAGFRAGATGVMQAVLTHA